MFIFALRFICALTLSVLVVMSAIACEKTHAEIYIIAAETNSDLGRSCSASHNKDACTLNTTALELLRDFENHTIIDHKSLSLTNDAPSTYQLGYSTPILVEAEGDGVKSLFTFRGLSVQVELREGTGCINQAKLDTGSIPAIEEDRLENVSKREVIFSQEIVSVNCSPVLFYLPNEVIVSADKPALIPGVDSTLLADHELHVLVLTR